MINATKSGEWKKQEAQFEAICSICGIMLRGNCASALQYVPELTWILFLRILDEKEDREQQEAEVLGVSFRQSLDAPYGARQKVISEVISGVERVRIDSERNFLDVLDKVHHISGESVDPTHVFPLS